MSSLRIKNFPKEKCPLTSKQDFSHLFSSIAKAISPVTVDSLVASMGAADGKHSAASTASRKYRIRTFVTLIALLIFQMYWLVGATIMTDLGAIQTRLTKLKDSDLLVTQSHILSQS